MGIGKKLVGYGNGQKRQKYEPHTKDPSPSKRKDHEDGQARLKQDQTKRAATLAKSSSFKGHKAW